MNKIKQIWQEKPLALRVILLLVISLGSRTILMTGGIILSSFTFLVPMAEYAIEHNSDVLISSVIYFSFTLCWALAFLILFLVKPLRPILKAITPKCKGNNLKMLLFGCVLGLGLNSLVVLGAYVHGDIQLSFREFNMLNCLFLLFAVFIQSSFEEYLYRGLILQTTAKYFHYPVLILVFNTALFARSHAENSGVTIIGILGVFFLGFLFSVLVYYADSLWAAIGMHAFWNFSQAFLWGLPNSGSRAAYSIFMVDTETARDSILFNSVSFGPESTLLAIFLLTSISLLIISWGESNHKKMTNIWE